MVTPNYVITEISSCRYITFSHIEGIHRHVSFHVTKNRRVVLTTLTQSSNELEKTTAFKLRTPFWSISYYYSKYPTALSPLPSEKLHFYESALNSTRG
jgi:hypothetical protein